MMSWYLIPTVFIYWHSEIDSVEKRTISPNRSNLDNGPVSNDFRLTQQFHKKILIFIITVNDYSELIGGTTDGIDDGVILVSFFLFSFHFRI